MKRTEQRNRFGFTLEEIIIVLGIIGLLVVVATPSYLRARHRLPGEWVGTDAQHVDASLD